MIIGMLPFVRKEVSSCRSQDMWLNIATVAYDPSLGGLVLASDFDKLFSTGRSLQWDLLHVETE